MPVRLELKIFHLYYECRMSNQRTLNVKIDLISYIKLTASSFHFLNQKVIFSKALYQPSCTFRICAFLNHRMLKITHYTL